MARKISPSPSPQPDTHSISIFYSLADAYTDAYFNPNTHAKPDANSYFHAYSDSSGDTKPNPDRNANCHQNPARDDGH